MKTNNVFFILLFFVFMGGVPFNAAQGSSDLHPGVRAIQELDRIYAAKPDHNRSLAFHNLVRTGKGNLDGHNFTGIDYTYHATEDDRRLIYKALIRSTLYPKDRTKEQQVNFLNDYLLTLFGVCIDQGQHFQDDYYHQLTAFVVSFLTITKDQPQRPEFYKFMQGFSNHVHQDTQFIDKIVASMPGVKGRTNNQQALEDFVKSIENSAAFKEAYGEVEGKKAGSSSGLKISAAIQQRLDFLGRDLSELNDILLTHKDMKAKGTAVYKQTAQNFDDLIDRNTAEKKNIEKEIKDLEASLLSPAAHVSVQPDRPVILLRKQPIASSSDASSRSPKTAQNINLTKYMVLCNGDTGNHVRTRENKLEFMPQQAGAVLIHPYTGEDGLEGNLPEFSVAVTLPDEIQTHLKQKFQEIYKVLAAMEIKSTRVDLVTSSIPVEVERDAPTFGASALNNDNKAPDLTKFQNNTMGLKPHYAIKNWRKLNNLSEKTAFQKFDQALHDGQDLTLAQCYAGISPVTGTGEEPLVFIPRSEKRQESEKNILPGLSKDGPVKLYKFTGGIEPSPTFGAPYVHGAISPAGTSVIWGLDHRDRQSQAFYSFFVNDDDKTAIITLHLALCENDQEELQRQMNNTPPKNLEDVKKLLLARGFPGEIPNEIRKLFGG